jgi:RHS repeat-associated protein
VVKKNYRAFRLGSNRELQDVVEVCPDPSAAYGDSRNIRMVTTFYGTNTVNYQIGRVKTVVYPNGRMDTRTYEYGTFVPAAGQTPPYFVSDPSGKHWCETVVHGTTNHPEGMAGRTIRETAVRDPMNQVVLAETWVYTGEGNYDRLAWETQSYDEWLHPVLVINSSGEKSEASWGGNCCGKLWERGPNGMEYEYVYDAIGSVVYRIKKGATTNAPDLYSSYTYDGAGRRLTETLLSGGLSLLVSSNTYDNAGRLAASVDAQGIVTAYAYNGLSNSTMRGGLTNTTVRYLSGSTKFTAENGATKTTYDYGVNADGSQWSKFFNGPDGLNSPVWQKTTVDSLGRGILVENPGFGGVAVVSTSCYNHQNQLVKTSRTSAPDTLYSYNEIAEQFRSGLDVNTNGVLDLAGPDRVSESAAWFEKDGAGNDWGCRASLLYAGNGSAVPITNGIQRLRLMGNEMPSNGLISEMIAADMLGNQTTSRTYVDRNAKTVIQVVTYPDSTNNSSQITINGQLASSTSKTGVRTDFSYDGLGRQVSAINHQPSTIRSVGSFTHYNAKGQVDWTMDAASNVTSFAYDSLGRRVAVTDALSNTVYTAYDADGRVTNTWGATYPVAYRYDDYGRMALMKTFRSEGGAGDETRWLYDEATGLLTNKLYADGKGTAYSYTPDGKLARRTWARGVATTYNYDSLNQLTNISYSDSTPTVGFTYDRLGRQITITDGTGTRAFAYNDALQLAAETNALGVLQYAFDGLGRPAGFDAGPGYSVRYAYDPLGRFSAVTSSVASASSVAGYSYLPGSDLVAGHANSDGFSVTRSYEPNRNLITQILNTSGTNVISRFGYVNDAVGRRTLRVDSASLTNAFGYNARSELVNASMGTNTYGYAYDPIGNRRTATNNAEALCYAANALNQYTNISNGAVITPQYDSDGNMTNYGAFAFAWDGENRLVGVSSNGQAVASFAYDFMSRRYQKVAGSTTNAFLYDGWAMISETIRNSSFAMTNSYVYGLDLSGTLQGAGTIGGILDMSLAGTNVVCAYDANGNLTDLVGAYGGAHYEYDPYGNTIAKTGVLADANPFRFSTKYLDDESSLYYYGYRYYQPESGRWLSRDPIQERGGRNLYAFALNAPGNYVDTYGETILGPTPSAADIMKFLSLLNDAKKCVEGMLAANKAATDWFKVIDDTYVCCGKKKAIAKVSDFPGADTGDFGSTHGVLHCALGVEARDHGVGDDCINTFNVLWEMWEFMSPKYWEWMPDWVPVFGSKGPEAWIKDTKSDMAAVIGGYKDKVKKEDCIPSSCHPKK